MEYIYIGTLVNTHGLKGEVRILSEFSYKEQIFLKGFSFYIGKEKEQVTIATYRVHKNYDMVTLEGITNIDDVLGFKGEKLYIKRSDLNVDGYFDEDLIGLELYDQNGLVGKVSAILKSRAHKIIVVDGTKMVPYVEEFIKQIDLENHKIRIESMVGLFDEN